jgi:pantoate--beta-alanine ligase
LSVKVGLAEWRNSTDMDTLLSNEEMSAWASAQRAQGRILGFVPTMGFLHEGHVSLMTRLRPHVDRLVVSIFVNPLQFGPDEDLDSYPRDPERDAAMCRAAGVDALFVPARLYPETFRTSVAVSSLTERWCGSSRPSHFEGVTTVVARLFGLTQCHQAAFGEKDYQQLAVVRQMVDDLAMPVEIVAGPLVRDQDGVALSSRNAYLDETARARARTLHQGLFAMRAAVAQGETQASNLLGLAERVLDCDGLDYLAVVDPRTLEPLTEIEGPARALVAAYYGSTRLIDNVALG